MLSVILDYSHLVVNVHTGAGRDELTDDDIFLQTSQIVALALDSRICESLCGLLEGCCRQERIGVGGCLCDTLDDGLDHNGLEVDLALCDPALDLLVSLVCFLLVDECAGEQQARTGVNYNNALDDGEQTTGSGYYGTENEPQKREITVSIDTFYNTASETVREGKYKTESTVAVVLKFDSPSLAYDADSDDEEDDGDVHYSIEISMPLVVVT